MSIQKQISRSGLTIYDPIPAELPELFLSAEDLEDVLQSSLAGKSYQGLPLRTRSKVVNQDICEALGYPVPPSFKKSKPRFPGQNFDKYVQKANNLQIWNEELEPTRRYAIIQVNENQEVIRVKVITGEDLALLDTTGTLTQKYQARLIPAPGVSTELISLSDTKCLSPLFSPNLLCEQSLASPVSPPTPCQLISIANLFESLKDLIGCEFVDAGVDQERNRGASLHRLVCERLGYRSFADNGRFPDILNQLLEIKLQTSPTIDLGLVVPSSTAPLDGDPIDGIQVRHCDIRYAIFHGETDGDKVTIRNFYLTTGEDFFHRFQQFGGKVLNKKLQIPLPSDFFEI